MPNDILRLQFLRSTAVDYLKRFIGLPYRWGGDDPMAGFDCSGLIVEVLQAVGVIPHGSDFTASQLYDRFEDKAVNQGYAGCLAFWYSGANERITHIEMMVDDFHTVGASGGGSSTATIDDAIRTNAFVKQRPLGYRGQNYLLCDPFLYRE